MNLLMVIGIISYKYSYPFFSLFTKCRVSSYLIYLSIDEKIKNSVENLIDNILVNQ
jgi:hypothetical protein